MANKGAKYISSDYVQRKHFACLLRLDVWDLLKKECERLQCTQGVYLEIVLQKAMLSELVKPVDMFSYSPQLRWFEKARHRLENGGDFYGHSLSVEQRSELISVFSLVIAGRLDLDSPDFYFDPKKGSYKGGRIAKIFLALTGSVPDYVCYKKSYRRRGGAS